MTYQHHDQKWWAAEIRRWEDEAQALEFAIRDAIEAVDGEKLIELRRRRDDVALVLAEWRRRAELDRTAPGRAAQYGQLVSQPIPTGARWAG
jgi:hypothetical protein